jgi:hypothetical protein
MASRGENTRVRRILIGKTKRKETTRQVLGEDGRIILTLNLEDEQKGTIWTGILWLRIRTIGEFCE